MLFLFHIWHFPPKTKFVEIGQRVGKTHWGEGRNRIDPENHLQENEHKGRNFKLQGTRMATSMGS